MPAESPAAVHTSYKTQVTRPGVEGLNLNKPLDALTPQELSRIANLYTTGSGDLVTRPGQTLLATGPAGSIHSVRRLNNPFAGTYTRFWGTSTYWARGQSGALNILESGFSGNPLTMIPVRPALSGESWMLVADSAKLRKATLTSASLPLGITPPGNPPTAAPTAILTTGIAAFDSSDGTQAANWTAFGGYDTDGNGPVTTPTLADVTGLSGSAVQITTIPGLAKKGYASVLCKAIALDLSKLQGGTVASTDDDFIHLYIQMNLPQGVQEIKLYFVCSAFYNTTLAIPGTSTYNPAAYVRSIVPSDYSEYIALTQTSKQAADQARITRLLTVPGAGPKGDPTIFEIPNPPLPTAPDVTGADLPFDQSVPGANAWTEYGRIGLPLRKADFLKIGAAGKPGSDWSTITGVYIVVQTVDLVPGSLVATPPGVIVAFDDLYLTGGFGPDTAEPGAQQYDYRLVNYDPRTGARSNGTALNTDGNGCTPLDALRQSITITPSAIVSDADDPAWRQEAYRRGGSLVDDWAYVGINTAFGGTIIDTLSDAALSNADTIPKNHFPPVSTIKADGTTVTRQPLPILFGPFDNGIVCGLGDQYRPGHLYACIPGEPDHWPSTGGYAIEVCAPSEELMNGGVWGGQGFVLSRERGYTVYSNLTGGEGIVATPSACTPGLAARWGFCVGPGGIYYVARDGIRVTTGDASTLLSDKLRPLFNGQTVNGYLPIDWATPASIRLEVYDLDLWFLYKDTGGTPRCLIYSLIYQYWRSYTFGKVPTLAAPDLTRDQLVAGGANLLILGSTDGRAYTHDGSSDDGTAIPYSCRTGAWDFGDPRNDKLLGDLILDADLQGRTLTVQCLLNVEATSVASQPIVGSTGRARYTLDPFGTVPTQARTVSVDLSGSTSSTTPITLSLLGMAIIEQPNVTFLRATDWAAPTGSTGNAYLTGCFLDVDTTNMPRTVLVEVDLDGVITTAATLTVTANGRHKLWFSWPAVQATAVRLRPTDPHPWQLYACDWLATPEPPKIAGWDTNTENKWDTYFTGVDLECNTFGVAKAIRVTVDGVEITGSPFTINLNGRGVVHLTCQTPLRGHVYRFFSTDTTVGQLYTWRWQLEEEPSEQSNWNQNYDDLGKPGQKYISGIVIECDTFGLAKTVRVEIDGVVAETLTVTANGRLSQRFGFTSGPYRGYVVRLLPTDSNPGRLYQKQWLFDQEPESTSRGQVENFDDLGDPGDKYITGLLIACDTLNLAKVVGIEIDGVEVEQLTITANGRTTQNFNFPSGPYFGKVVRLRPHGTGVIQIWAKKWLQEKEPDRTAGFAVLNFTDLEWPGEKYVTGILIEADTSGQPKTVNVEIDGVVAETLTVNTPARRILQFNFPGGPYRSAKVLRLRPTDTNPGKLYAAQWLFEKEPADTAGFGVLNFQDLNWVQEKYLTGIILEIDTFCNPKYMWVEVDGVVVETILLQTRQRAIQQFHFAGGPYPTAKVVRLLPADTVVGKLYATQWLFDPEPVDNAGFGVQNWSILGYPTDKYVKGILLECDTHGVDKTVRVEGDGGVLIAGLTVNATGRQVLEFSFPQVLARVVRLRATDVNPGKIYTAQWIFDAEPLALSRWETQLLDFEFPSSGWGSILSGDVCYRSTQPVTWTVTVYNSLGALLGTLAYTLPATGGLKQKVYVPLDANKGVLYKFVFTASVAFTLYQEESRLRVKGWSEPGIRELRNFGNDDLDTSRVLRIAAVAAARSGGGT